MLLTVTISLKDGDIVDDDVITIVPASDSDPVIAKSIKKIICEFAINYQRAIPYTNDDERIIYAEVFASFLGLKNLRRALSIVTLRRVVLTGSYYIVSV